MHAMILAAGRGERMRPLTDHTPKPLLCAGGRPLIEWHLRRLAAAGIVDVVINHAHLGAMIEQALGDGAAFGLRITYSPEAVALETAGGIARALPRLGQAPFAVINGDIWSDWDLRRLPGIAAQMYAGGLDAWCVLVENPTHNPGGDFCVHNGLLRNDGQPRLTFSGIGVYAPSLFAGVGQDARSPLAPLLREAAARSRAGAERHRGAWTDVGTPQRLAELDAQLRPDRAN